MAMVLLKKYKPFTLHSSFLSLRIVCHNYVHIDFISCGFLSLTVDPTPNKPMSARTAADHQRLKETHELQLLKQAEQALPRGRGKQQPAARPTVSSSKPVTRPPMSQQLSHNVNGDTSYNMSKVQYHPSNIVFLFLYFLVLPLWWNSEWWVFLSLAKCK